MGNLNSTISANALENPAESAAHYKSVGGFSAGVSPTLNEGGPSSITITLWVLLGLGICFALFFLILIIHDHYNPHPVNDVEEVDDGGEFQLPQLFYECEDEKKNN